MLDIAAKQTLTGSYGTKVVEHPNLSTAWTPVLSTNKAGTTFLTHKGLYTVWARVYSTSADLPWLRLVYGVGDIVAPQENTQVRVPGISAFYLVNLGQINIQALPFGAQRWEGVIQARGELGGENISIDRLWFECADECSGVLGALTSTVALSSIAASDSLMGTGVLKESEASHGGKWEEVGSSKGGFTRGANGAERLTKEESEGRTALLSGSTTGTTLVKAEVEASSVPTGLTQAIYLRYFSSTYWIRVGFLGVPLHGSQQRALRLEWQAGGSVEVEVFGTLMSAGTTFVELEAEINAVAAVTIRLGADTYNYTLPSTFKKGETHAEGKLGVFDFNPSATEALRLIRYFVASALPTPDAVMYASKAAFLSTNGMYRESSDGAGAGPIGHPGADLPRLPVSGPEEAPVEIAVKPSRGQFGEVADSGKDLVKVQVSYRPCYASIPEE